MKKMTMAMFVGLMVALYSSMPGFASQNTIVDEFLCEYSDYRAMQFTEESIEQAAYVSDDSYETALERVYALQMMEDRIEADFVSVNTTFNTKDTTVDGEYITIVCEEYNEIAYNKRSNGITENMGFGVEHSIVLRVVEQDFYMVSDSFDERLITGVCSSDLDSVFSDSVNTPSFIINQAMLIDSDDPSIGSGGYNYNGALAALYADTWCNSYNSAFTNYDNDGNSNTSDCANFVSQCVFAGGMAADSWAANGYTTRWYPDSAPWVNVAWFNVYWQGRGIPCNYISPSSQWGLCKVGNPIFWLNTSGGASGHLMICVGVGSDGVPLYDAHSPSEYHMPITNYVNKTLYTLMFVR